MISCFYPTLEEEKEVSWLHYGSKSIEGLAKGTADPRKNNSIHSTVFRHFYNAKFLASVGGKLIENREKFTPFVFSHGNGSTRRWHVGTCKELVS